jgi:hypothetical protein
MNKQHVHFSFGVLGTLVGMKRSRNTAKHNTPVIIQNLVSRNELYYQYCFFYLNCVGVFWQMERICGTALIETFIFRLILNVESHLKTVT